ncbi:MAG: cyclic nucleotide-binding domain-containing protein [Candidatus Cloacimonetes bacterium]|nr:cyclic nucleotide-binding domain-containing protein [Candidatus Cloacimonadota bacterium]
MNKKEKVKKIDEEIEELKNYKLLNGLKTKGLKQIRNLLLKREFKKGEQVFRANYPQVVLFFVAEGDIKIYLDNDGEELVLTHKVKYEHFGEMALILESTRTASARAEEDSTLLAMTSKDFEDFINKNPSSGIILLKNIGRFLSEMLRKNNEMMKNLQNKNNEKEV